MKQFKVSRGAVENLKIHGNDVKSSQMIVDKVNEIHSGINEDSLKLVNQHLVNHFNSKVIPHEQPNNPLIKIRNKSKTQITSMLQSQISSEIESIQNLHQYNEILAEKDKEINYYRNHVQQLTEELQKLTELFETVKNENFNLKQQLESVSNLRIIVSNHQKQILQLHQENEELESILKNTLLQQERQRFQSHSSKQSLIVKKNSLNGQKLKLYDQISLQEQINRSNMSSSFVSCPEQYLQKEKTQRSNERVKTAATVSTLPDSKATQFNLITLKENRKMRY